MTACTNHGGKARRVVTAALVGVLSVGTVPMVALAANDGISTMALSASEAFQNGTLTRAEDNEGRSLSIPADGIITVQSGKYVVPTQVAPKDAEDDPVDLFFMGINTTDSSQANATIQYDSETAQNVTAADLKTPGRYTAKVTMNANADEYNGATFTVTFIVEDAADLSDAVIFDNSNGKNNVSDTTFTYNAGQQKAGLAIDGKALVEGIDFQTTYKDLEGNWTDGSTTNSYPVGAGTYEVTFKGIGNYAGQTRTVTFTVDQLDLSTASIVVADQLTGFGGSVTAGDITINGTPLTAFGTQIRTNVSYNGGETGEGDVLFTVASGYNVVESANVNFSVVSKYADDVYYNGSSVKNGTVSVNLSDGGSFKPERIEVFDASDKPLDSSYYTVTYTDANGNTVDASALANPGTYTVRVDVNSAASHYQYGDKGDLKFEVNVISAVVEDSDVVFKFDGKVGDSFKPTYTGEDMLERLETVVHTKWGDDLVEGTDYTVQAYKGDEKVGSVVDAGLYTVKIELKGNYGNSLDLDCTIDVQQLKLDTVFVNGGDLAQYTYVEEGRFPWLDRTVTVWYLGYTGEDLEPTFELGYYTDKDGKVVTTAAGVEADPDAYTWHALTSDEIEVTGYTDENGKSVDVMNAKGEYEVRFALNSGNYTTSARSTSNVITVSDAKVGFVDVNADAWYAQGVFDAKQLGYVKGVSGTDMYAPESKISRADALIIISRMAGFDQTVTAEDYLSVNGGYVTRYTDVDMGAYYAKAVAWGTKMGIVNGYGDGTFGPDDPITREQFAGMLANYAKATGDYATPSADALDGIADASSVDAWANEAVSWAVENGVMGNGGYVYAQNEISRAEVACMAVNYQPEGASTSVIG